MKQVHIAMNITEMPADLVDGERVELIRLGGPRDGERMGYATVRLHPDGERELIVDEPVGKSEGQ